MRFVQDYIGVNRRMPRGSIGIRNHRKYKHQRMIHVDFMEQIGIGKTALFALTALEEFCWGWLGLRVLNMKLSYIPTMRRVYRRK